MMKKVMKRAVALGLASLMILSMVGCGNKETNGKGKHNGGKEVEITYWNAGLGTEWLDKLCNAFNESQSDWYVTYTAIADSAAIEAKLGQTDLDETDLYIGSSTKKTEYLEPLDELLDETAKGDKKTAGGGINLVLLTKIGDSFTKKISLDELEEFITTD